MGVVGTILFVVGIILVVGGLLTGEGEAMIAGFILGLFGVLALMINNASIEATDDAIWCQSIEGTTYSAEGNCYKNGIKLTRGEE